MQYDASMNSLTYIYMKDSDFIFIHEFNQMKPLQPLFGVFYDNNSKMILIAVAIIDHPIWYNAGRKLKPLTTTKISHCSR